MFGIVLLEIIGWKISHCLLTNHNPELRFVISTCVTLEPHGRKKAGRWNGQYALGPMCDEEKDWHEHSFRASGAINREIKLDVTWSYVKRQTAKMTSEFVFFSSDPSLNQIKIEKCLLLFATNTNISTVLFKELKTDDKSFIFAVCRLTKDHVTSSLISLMAAKNLLSTNRKWNFLSLFLSHQ